MKEELLSTTREFEEEGSLLSALVEKNVWFHAHYQQSSTIVIKSIAYDESMKDQVIIDKIGQRILKVVDIH